ncbi:MAG: CDP-diacylglycerol--glycerol-3-phosphate 3-phosphatidyltransferase [Planctomycetota bacterium]
MTRTPPTNHNASEPGTAPPTPGESGPLVTGPLAHLPNALTVLRLILAIGFFVVLSAYRFPDQNAWALPIGALLFTIAAVTDALDGYLARRWRVITVFGRIFDPFADKFLVLGAFILLAGPMFASTVHGADAPRQVSGVHPWMVIAILSRELLVTTIRGACESRGVDFSATFSGKLKMIVQSVAVPLILVSVALVERASTGENGGFTGLATFVGYVLPTIAWIVVLVTIWSAIPYTVRGLQALKTSSPQA